MKKNILFIFVLSILIFSSITNTYALTGINNVLIEPFDICESSGFLQALLIVKTLFSVVCYIIPIILIFTMSMDIYKLVSNPSDTKKVFPIIKKRLIAALIIVFIPTIVRTTMNVLGNYSDFADCWRNANSNYIETLKEKEKTNNNSNQ